MFYKNDYAIRLWVKIVCLARIFGNERGGAMEKKNIKNLLQEYRNQLEAVSEAHIEKMILFGSYARGDFRKDSDIDVMILVDLEEIPMKRYEDKVYDITYDFNYKYGTDIMPIVQNMNHFNYWKGAYMFYKNVEEEGVVI